jgi:2-aminoethylphosphonate-pyruvate transaminase
MSPTRVRLLNPGPVTLSPKVRRALLRQDLCHCEPEYSALQSDVRRRLTGVYPAADREFAAVLFTGSGTAAIEAMLGSLVPPSGRALVAANGIHGERLAAILQVHGRAHEVVRSEWEQAIRLDEIAARLRGGPPITHVVAVHHETTTGRLNNLDALGALCREHGTALLVDAVSSFGGERIEFDAWNVEAVAGTANMCLHGVPGVAFVVVRRSALARPSSSPTLYLDLARNHEEQARGYPPFTPAMQSLFGLHEALVELDGLGGWQARHAHYRELSGVLRAGMRESGFGLLLDERVYGSTLSSFRLPHGIGFDALYHRLKDRGFVIDPGEQALRDTIFRIAVMGDLSIDDMEELLAALSAVVGRVRVHA